MLPAIALGLGVAGAAANWWAGNKAADAQRATANEEERRRELERKQVLGEATARAGASGVDLGGSESMTKYLGDMAAEFRRQHDWAVRQATSASDLTKLANGLDFATSLGSSLFSYGQANNWFRTTPAVR